MRYSLTNMLIKTRVPVFYWVGVLIISLILIPTIIISSDIAVNLPMVTFGKIVSTIAISFISLAIILLSGFHANKTDYDFLLDIPLEKNELLSAYYIINLIFLYIPFLFLIFASIFGITHILFSLVFINVAIVFFISINLGIISKNHGWLGEFIPFIFFAFLIIPSIINFRYSITSVYYGYYLSSTLVSILILLVTTLYIIKSKTPVRINYVYENNNKKIRQQNIHGSPLSVIYRKNTMYFNTIFVRNRISSVKVHYWRSGIYKIILVFSIVGVLYLIININLSHFFTILPDGGAFISSGQLIGIDIYIIFMSTFLYNAVKSQWAVFLERPWLTFTSMSTHKYIKNFILSNALSIIIGIFPLTVVTLAMLIINYNMLNLLIFLYTAIMPPVISIIFLYSNMIISPKQFNNDSDAQDYIRGGSQLLRMLPVFIIIIAGLIIAGFSLFFNNMVYISIYYIFILILIFYSINSKWISGKIADKMINSGMV